MSYMPNVNYTITDIYQLAWEADFPSFQRRAMTYVQCIVEHDASLWLIGNYQTGSACSISTKGMPGNLPESTSEPAEYAPLWNDAIRKPGIVYDPADHVPDEAFFKSDLYIEYLAKYGIERMLQFPFLSTGVQDIGVIVTLFRFEQPKRFTAQEKLSYQWIAPHLVHAFDLCLAREFSRRKEQGVEVAYGDVTGQIYRATANFKKTLRENFQSEGQPRKIIEKALQQGQFSGNGHTLMVDEANDMYFYSIRPRSKTDNLSSMELKIAERLALGTTIKTVARELDLSPGTVSSHLHRVYKKLGISSKSALIELFRR